MTERPRLIEVAFPLKQTSLDSVHEKNVRHGHISTLHIWPARRPLAACRAALVCTLLPDPGDEKVREEILERLAGRVVKKVKKKKSPSGRVEETVVEETEGGILHWGRESGPDLDWFRQKIRDAYGGRVPKVLDPFAGGGAIPLEAMRLGCEATAIDINPVAWFILKCTLEYPQKLAGQLRPLPKFALDSPEFMEEYRRKDEGAGAGGRRKRRTSVNATQGHLLEIPDADLAWHVRAWGWWVLQRARADLERFYPIVNGKPTVAYLWARTVTCKNCRATLPLLKTRWLSKKDRKRVVLAMLPNAARTGVTFEIQYNVPVGGGNAAQRREHDGKIGAGTMSRSGATCPCCGTIMTMEDIRLEGQAGRLGTVMTAVVVKGSHGVVKGAHGKEYRLPTNDEIQVAKEAAGEVERVFAMIPFGLPTEPVPKGGSGASRAFSVDGYGLDQWYKLFTPRQLVALGTIVKHIRAAHASMRQGGHSEGWSEAIMAYLAACLARLLDFANCGVQWKLDATTINHSFVRFALPITWDYAEGNVLGDSAGSYKLCYERICSGLDTYRTWPSFLPPRIIAMSATKVADGAVDIVVTDPPYYDAIPYADLMDFFYVWHRRVQSGVSAETDATFRELLSPKWDHEKNDGELIDDASRFGGNEAISRAVYEDGMYRAFLACRNVLKPEGHLVIVFAHK
ncbi:MAG: DUF1156 domain-containing protein, partial [bacterium]